ncbi:MAG: amino acid--tRNA ligase-related protein [Actinocrinis sp.]
MSAPLSTANNDGARALLRLRHHTLAAARDHLFATGFVELPAPILSASAEPGEPPDRRAEVEFRGRRFRLSGSSLLYRQAGLRLFDRICYLAPNLAPELPGSGEYEPEWAGPSPSAGAVPAESYRLDVELAGAARDDVMRLAEELIGRVVERLVDHAADDLAVLGADPDRLNAMVRKPFERYQSGRTGDLADRPRPFFVTDIDRPAYTFADRGQAEGCAYRNFRLVTSPSEPGAVLVVGSEHEHEYARILARIRRTGENPAKYGPYLKLVREGIPSGAGFGLGVERLTRHLAGLDA